jgi:hypothetical protein
MLQTMSLDCGVQFEVAIQRIVAAAREVLGSLTFPRMTGALGRFLNS